MTFCWGGQLPRERSLPCAALADQAASSDCSLSLSLSLSLSSELPERRNETLALGSASCKGRADDGAFYALTSRAGY